jgi:beta-mannosidase
MTPVRTPIHEGWTVRPLTALPPGAGEVGEIGASVPGCVHLDLLAARLIADPYVDDNEELQHWVGETTWQYRTSFPYVRQVGMRTDLVFEGLDTIAEVRLNGTVVARTENMHRCYRLPVDADLVDGVNEVEVTFQPPTTVAAHVRDAIGDLPNPYGRPYNFVRKMACNFGWDWGPRLTTSGIWRPVFLESWSTARIAAVRPSVSVTTDGTGMAEVAVDVEREAPDDLVVVCTVAGTRVQAQLAPGATQVRLTLAVPDVERWWPAGRGAQTRYDLQVELHAGGDAVDRAVRHIGFRTVEIDRTPEADGSRWAIVVNGERVWVRGFNWIPDDPFPGRVDRQRYRARLDEVRAANANLLRIWGGGIYESDDFYDLCDEYGVLVWQDFLFACAAYPEEVLADEVRAEATDAVNRLMSHPSLALWCGNNENLLGWWDWDWQAAVGDRSWGLGFYTELLPSIVAALDPLRPYIEGSPASGDPAIHPNDPANGPIHIWDVWNERDYADYRTYRPRFVSEFGFQAPPTQATLASVVTNRPLHKDDPSVLHHQKAFDGHEKLERALLRHFGTVADTDDWLYLTQVNQARAIRLGVGHLRSLHERCSGAVWWQINDCWPVISWAVLDSEGRRKPAWYAARDVFADRCLVIDPTGDGLTCVAVNDSRHAWETTLTLQRMTLSGQERGRIEVPVLVPADAAHRLAVPPALAAAGDAPDDMLVVTATGGERTVWAWQDDVVLPYPAPRMRTEVQRGEGQVVVTVSADGVLRDLCLFVDRIDPHAVVDTNLVTLLPGETHRFVVHTADPGLAWASATTRPVLRSVGDRAREGAGTSGGSR